ncbi:MAG: histidinol-phosphatase HisJ family protein [Sellimonas sp.]|uniref:histidinol-phosphatase HisJ family protein n=1 Tax=Sellimonas sp. TaxID=2021466 RepID=UPI0039A13A58
MVTADYHMHTRFSSDSDADPKDMVEAAIKKGLQTICFTDHQDTDYPEDQSMFRIDMERYIPTITELQERYKGQIDIRLGVEIGLQPHLGEWYRSYIKAYPFDFVIGSVHVVEKMDPYNGEFFDKYSDREGYRRSFEETLENVRAIQDFDVLGHMDYIVRYGKEQAAHYCWKDHADIIDEILRELIDSGKGIEMNMAGFKYGLSFCHPYPDIIKRYRELGGEILTVGADAHKPEHIAYNYAQAAEILKEAGFAYYTVFHKRKPEFVKIV